VTIDGSESRKQKVEPRACKLDSRLSTFDPCDVRWRMRVSQARKTCGAGAPRSRLVLRAPAPPYIGFSSTVRS
jgi:hypothetical protein